MKMILSGSRAIKHNFPDFPREPKDWDFIIDDPKVKSSIKGVEYKCIPPISNQYIDHKPLEILQVLSPSGIMTLKASHIFWEGKDWQKHYEDLIFLSKKGVKIDEKLFYELYDFWTKKFGKRKESDLSLSKAEFFDNKLSLKYDHDRLHELLSYSIYRGEPTYKMVLKDGSQVEPDPEKFQKLSEVNKHFLVAEEVWVMAYERRTTQDYQTAYSWMLKRFLRHHAPLWEAIYIVENLHDLQSSMIDYVKKLDYELS